MITNKSTRIIDLTVGELEAILDFKLTHSQPGSSISNQKDNDEIGGYELAEKITGYDRQTLYQKKSAGQIPYMQPPSGGVFFSKNDLIAWLKSHKRITDNEISEMAVTLPLKRSLRRK